MMPEPQNGRIGGGVLKDNLLRQGVNLNFANVSADVAGGTPLIHLDVVNSKIGIRTDAPVDDLTVNDTLGANNLTTNFVNVADLEIQNSQITTTAGDINLGGGSNIFATSIATDGLKLDFNTIRSTVADSNIELRPATVVGSLVRTLDNPNAFALSDGDRFGQRVAISGNYAIVTADREDDAGGFSSGKAYIFDVTTGNLLHTLDNPNAVDTSNSDRFGYSAAIDGNYAIVGTPFEDDAIGAISSGRAYIYNVTTGALVHTLDNPNAYDTVDSDYFGVSVAISGNYAIIGASYEDDAVGNNSGKAYIFNVTTGALVHTLDNPNAYGTPQSDFFGISVAISGNYAIVGAQEEEDAGGTRSGKAYIYNVTTGALVHTLDNPNPYGASTSDYFGGAVAISGNYAIVGAQYEDEAGTFSSGKAYIFNVTTGALVHTLDNPNAYGTPQSDFFGDMVAIDGNYAVVGVQSEDDVGGNSSGKAYIFDVTTGALVTTIDNPNAFGGSDGDFFGNSVGISGDYIIVAAFNEGEAGNSLSGKAYIFTTVPSTGVVNIRSNFNITGNLHATGNIETTGDIVFGSDDQDDVTFAADVNSNIIPDVTDTSDLGRQNKKWLNIYSNLLNGERVEVDTVFIQDTSLSRRQGNMFYVSVNGDDTNVGDHQHGPFRTISHALSVSDSSAGGPVTIHIYPGEYEETFPLVVPENVTVRGEDIRNVIIKPTSATNTNNAFELTQNTTVADVTIKDFYAPGYAFVFQNGTVISERSPYIRNVTVITKGTEYAPPIKWSAISYEILQLAANITTGPLVDFFTTQSPSGYLYGDISNTTTNPTVPYYASFAAEISSSDALDALRYGDGTYAYGPGMWVYDEFRPALEALYFSDKATYSQFFEEVHPDPRFFESGDAGGGAYIDGGVLDSATLEGSMLFHSATFITPGVDCITMTNGARVEWLNSFTYFANRGLYATQGLLGLGSNGSRFGAEIRSIGSANVYGNYGAEADGADTLMYLIGHNFGYIGAGKNVDNDLSLFLQDQETVELNNGKIHYVTTDQSGTFRVGDAFFANFEDGTTSFDLESVNLDDVSALYIGENDNITYIDGTLIETGNIRISGNTITTTNDGLIFSPNSDYLDLANNPALIIARGTNLQRNDVEGEIRYNTDSNLFEGFSTGNLSFGGIYSSDRETSVDVHPTNDSVVLTVDNVEIGTIDVDKVSIHGLGVDDVLFDGNVVSSNTLDTDLILERGVTNESLIIDNIIIKNNNIINTSNDIQILRGDSSGYIKFGGEKGLVIPSGPDIDRPANPPDGMMRYNTSTGQLEVYDTISWQSATGAGGGVDEAIINDLLDLYVLILG